MSQTGLTAFDHTIQATNVLLNELAERLGWPDRQRNYHALRAVLHALRDRLPVDQVAALGAQLPLLVRGVYYEGWRPAGKPAREHKVEFLAHIRKEFPGDPEAVARAVFTVLAKHVSAGEIKHVLGVLPPNLRELWTEESRSLWV
jgi:uncharacterized protein (DUF2267 family)